MPLLAKWAVPPVCKADPAGLGAGTMTVKVLQYENWTLSSCLWPGDGSSKKVRGAVFIPHWNAMQCTSLPLHDSCTTHDLAEDFSPLLTGIWMDPGLFLLHGSEKFDMCLSFSPIPITKAGMLI